MSGPVLLGPHIRRTYLNKYLPPAKGDMNCLLVGVVERAEPEMIEAKGYKVIKADLYPRDNTIVKMDITKPEEKYHGQFDVVVAFDILEHIEDDRAAVAGMKSLLKPGGRAFVHTPGGDIHAPLTEMDIKHGHVRRGYTEAQVKDVIESTSFASVTYLKTFNATEMEAYYFVYNGGDYQEGIDRLKNSPFDGASGKCHMFILEK